MKEWQTKEGIAKVCKRIVARSYYSEEASSIEFIVGFIEDQLKLDCPGKRRCFLLLLVPSDDKKNKRRRTRS